MTLALPMTTHAQGMVGTSHCPAGVTTINNGDQITINPQQVTSDRVAVNALFPHGLSQADLQTYSGAGNATGARVLLGVVGDNGKLIHNFYVVLGNVINDGFATVPSKIVNIHSLEPSTRYQARIFIDRIEGTNLQDAMRRKRVFSGRCFQTAS